MLLPKVIAATTSMVPGWWESIQRIHIILLCLTESAYHYCVGAKGIAYVKIMSKKLKF